jgi:hypothetical protein
MPRKVIVIFNVSYRNCNTRGASQTMCRSCNLKLFHAPAKVMDNVPVVNTWNVLEMKCVSPVYVIFVIDDFRGRAESFCSRRAKMAPRN